MSKNQHTPPIISRIWLVSQAESLLITAAMTILAGICLAGSYTIRVQGMVAFVIENDQSTHRPASSLDFNFAPK